MIRLEHLRKEFPGQRQPAIADLSLSVPEGDIAVLVGPSGCGKTTTMRIVNRIIEPTSGRIFIDGEDVTRRDADELRRHIGYVIQQVGLFPHMTIADNVATVPRLLRWDRAKVRRRVDEMLALVGLDPAQYRGRYPKQLSGGQQQRVGVARALCADPPVMLMDEPFGAIDPITRDRLQNEFLRLQAEIRKTIVFVTHDIDEALKMGDRIAILRDQSEIAQYDTPENVLAAPADDFVRDFIGGRAALRRLNLAKLTRGHMAAWPAFAEDQPAARAREQLQTCGAPAVVVLDRGGAPVRWACARDLERPGALSTAGSPIRHAVPLDASLADVLDELLRTQAPGVAVVDGDGRYVGVVDMATVSRAAGSMPAAVAEGGAAVGVGPVVADGGAAVAVGPSIDGGRR
jgi:osmoprotectant transport system ATP-binding protein